MPARVHLVSIHPDLDEDGQLHLKLSVAGDSRDRALELARRMEDSRRFNMSRITAESWHPDKSAGASDPFQCTIEAIYIPETVPVSGPQPATEKNTEISKRTMP